MKTQKAGEILGKMDEPEKRISRDGRCLNDYGRLTSP